MSLQQSVFSILAVSLIGAFALASTADAQRSRYRDRDREQHVAGKFDYFQLVLSWSPTHCAENSRGRNDTQCGLRRARPYAFVLHGLFQGYTIIGCGVADN